MWQHEGRLGGNIESSRRPVSLLPSIPPPPPFMLYSNSLRVRDEIPLWTTFVALARLVHPKGTLEMMPPVLFVSASQLYGKVQATRITRSPVACLFQLSWVAVLIIN